MANKRNTKFTEKGILEDTNVYLTSENHFLRKKNEELAKALAEVKLEYQKLAKNSFEEQGRLYYTDVERVKYKEFVKSLSFEVQTHVQQFFILTEQMTNTLNKINLMVKSPNELDHFIHTSVPPTNINLSSSRSKTAAVMPMVGGHTIVSPIINLPRITVEQLTEMMNSNSNGDGSSNSIEADEIEFADNVVTDNEDDLEDNSDGLSELVNHRLETMQEVDEEQSVSSPAVLSGIFKDVKVYISPHRFRSKGSSNITNRNKLSIKQTPNILLMANSGSNSDDSTTLTPGKKESAGTVNSTNNSLIQSQIESDTKYNSCGNNNITTSNMYEQDPLEGPSSLWNNTEGTDIAMGLAPKETSTPYDSSFRRKKSKVHFDEPQTPNRSRNITKRTRSTSDNQHFKSEDLDEPKVSAKSRGVTKKIRSTSDNQHFKSEDLDEPKVSTKSRGITKKIRSTSYNPHYKAENLDELKTPPKSRRITKKKSSSKTRLSSMSNCTVRLQKMSPTTLMSYASSASGSSTNFIESACERRDSPTVLERSRHSIRLTGRSKTRNTSGSNYATSPQARSRRNVKQVLYKEPSLTKKMRR